MVGIDSEDTPEGNKDLFSVVQAVKVPVLARDWYIHPLQIVDAKEAGAAGLVGVIAQVQARAWHRIAARMHLFSWLWH